MYRLESREHFEDWYVADATLGEFESLEAAVEEFCKERRQLLQEYSTAGIDQCIAESFGGDLEGIEDYTKGYVLFLYNDNGGQIAWQHFDYDHQTHRLKQGSTAEIDEGSTTPEERPTLRRLLAPENETPSNG